MLFDKITESESNYNHLEQMSVTDLLANINKEDQTVPWAVQKAIPQIETAVNKIVNQLKNMNLSDEIFLTGDENNFHIIRSERLFSREDDEKRISAALFFPAFFLRRLRQLLCEGWEQFDHAPDG